MVLYNCALMKTRNLIYIYKCLLQTNKQQNTSRPLYWLMTPGMCENILRCVQ